MDNSSVNHILKKHGNPKTEESRGQIAVTKEDFTLIPDIIKNSNKIERSKTKAGLDAILYTKTFENGTTYYIEEVRKY